MYKLVLNVGDYVRNINETSRRYRCRGTVTNVSENNYYVEYSNGIRQSYQKESAHNYLEKIGNVSISVSAYTMRFVISVLARCIRPYYTLFATVLVFKQ